MFNAQINFAARKAVRAQRALREMGTVRRAARSYNASFGKGQAEWKHAYAVSRSIAKGNIWLEDSGIVATNSRWFGLANGFHALVQLGLRRANRA